MSLTEKGRKIKTAMKQTYGAKKGEQVFHASKQKGTITGIDVKNYVKRHGKKRAY